jgi:hypothetical protein
MYLGRWEIDDLLTFAVSTHDPDTTGNPAKDADSVPTYRVYEDETGTPILTGSMALLDSTNTVGLYSEQITLSAANGFEVGKVYSIYISATVDSIVGTTVRQFQVEDTIATLTDIGDEVASRAMTLTAAYDAAKTAATQTSVDDLPTNAELATSQAAADDATLAAIAALNNLSVAQVNTEVDTALADIRLDELLAADSDIDGAAPPTVGSVFHELMTKTAGSFTYDQTTDALEAIRDNMGTAQTGDSFARLGAPAGASVSADIAAIEAQTDDIGVAGAGLTAVWDELLSGHAISGSTGEALSAAGTAGDPWTTALPGAYGSGTAGKIIGDNVNATISSRATQTSVDDIPTNAELATSQATADDVTLAAIAALNNISAAQVNAEVDTALADVGVTTTITGRIDVAVSTRASQVSVDDLPTNAELATSQASADDATLAAIAALNGSAFTAIPWNATWDAEVQSEVADALEVAIADSIPADGTIPSVKQALYMLTQFMLERSVATTTVTIKKADGSTTLFTLTLDDATTPTSITRAT